MKMRFLLKSRDCISAEATFIILVITFQLVFHCMVSTGGFRLGTTRLARLVLCWKLLTQVSHFSWNVRVWYLLRWMGWSKNDEEIAKSLTLERVIIVFGLIRCYPSCFICSIIVICRSRAAV